MTLKTMCGCGYIAMGETEEELFKDWRAHLDKEHAAMQIQDSQVWMMIEERRPLLQRD